MKIDRDMIRHLETLSRIRLEPDEIGPLSEQLERIIAFVQTLQAVNTDDVPATTFISHSGETPFREDILHQGLDRDTVLGMAPDAAGGFFRVPRVIDKKDQE